MISVSSRAFFSYSSANATTYVMTLYNPSGPVFIDGYTMQVRDTILLKNGYYNSGIWQYVSKSNEIITLNRISTPVSMLYQQPLSSYSIAQPLEAQPKFKI